MRWQLAGDWPIGQFCIPAGTVLSSGAGEAPIWNGVALPMPMPINSAALDEEAALLMLQWYEPHDWYRLHFGPGINREAIMARAAASPRLANRHGY
jgi:hypothetical protein